MALLTLQQLKDYLRKETTGEDALLTELLAEAVAMAEAYLDRPITTRTAQVFTDLAIQGRTYDPPRQLRVPLTPIATVSVTDADGTAVDATTYTVDAWAGLLRTVSGFMWSNGPYAITADVGLGTDPQYAISIEPMVNALIRDLAADLYQHRSPASTSENAGGGVSVAYGPDGLPRRTAVMVQAWRYLKAVA